MKKIVITVNNTKPDAEEASKKLKNMLEKRGATVIVSDKAVFEDGVSLYISLGGDGSLLRLASSLLAEKIDVPVLGINIGHVGYMSQIDFEKCEEADIEKLFNGDCAVEERMVLQTEVKRKGETVFKGRALNDFVILRSHETHMSEYRLFIGEKTPLEYFADGIIFATPIGSTAYSLSAGGPVVDSALDAFIVTPICAHSLFSKPIVLSGEKEIKLTMNERSDSLIFAQNDGVTVLKIEDGDEITISKSKNKLKMLRLGEPHLVGTLKAKLG